MNQKLPEYVTEVAGQPIRVTIHPLHGLTLHPKDLLDYFEVDYRLDEVWAPLTRSLAERIDKAQRNMAPAKIQAWAGFVRRWEMMSLN